MEAAGHAWQKVNGRQGPLWHRTVQTAEYQNAGPGSRLLCPCVLAGKWQGFGLDSGKRKNVAVCKQVLQGFVKAWPWSRTTNIGPAMEGPAAALKVTWDLRARTAATPRGGPFEILCGCCEKSPAPSARNKRRCPDAALPSAAFEKKWEVRLRRVPFSWAHRNHGAHEIAAADVRADARTIDAAEQM